MPTTLPSQGAGILLSGFLLLLSGCNRIIEPDNGPPQGPTGVPVLLRVEVSDSLLLDCPQGLAVDSAHHWIDPTSSLRLDPGGRGELSVLAVDRPPSGAGEARCGAAGRERGVIRPGGYVTRTDGTLELRWDSVPRPDTSGVWVTSNEAWLSDARPISNRELVAVLRFQEVEVAVVLDFSLEDGG